MNSNGILVKLTGVFLTLLALAGGVRAQEEASGPLGFLRRSISRSNTDPTDPVRIPASAARATKRICAFRLPGCSSSSADLSMALHRLEGDFKKRATIP